jgi:DNA-binding NtrC family response regulator
MSASGVNRTILHVDDDPQITRLMGVILQRQGFEVASLNDPTAALGEIIRHGYRIVLLDIDMPGIDGLQLLRRIKEYDGGIQVIMLTGLVTLSNAMATFRGGAEACFFKPLDDVEPLIAALHSTFQKIEHWWQALHNLTRQRRQAEALASAAT